jgi:hypothetical protein
MRVPVWVLALGVGLLSVGRAGAHSLGAECRLKGGKVEVEAYYSDDTTPTNARVTVRDAAGKVVAEGRTDTAGRWSFDAPPPGRYKVIVDAGDGHIAKKTMTVPAGSAAGLTIEASPAPDVRISEGPGRKAFTRVPWLKIVLGLGFIGVAGAALWCLLGRRRPVAPEQGDHS